ncbi:serine C-palmitoyltransferase [Malassezia cuniculi]|uniref:serine C-palmitoyltransferase n=1 Tax=Malassezia cuniculi TaxID=948313 RepID=A0AAF0EYL9_9BASI|nr:serine C-palmitoyltransferase [Malassezia cuniculi]
MSTVLAAGDSSAASAALTLINRIPGSAIVLRYIASSYQNDPIRSLLELVLFGYALYTILRSRTRDGNSDPNFVQLSEKEIGYLIAEFEPEPLVEPLNEDEQRDLDSIPMIIGGASAHPHIVSSALVSTTPRQVVNLSSFNFTGLVESPQIRERAIEILREYGVGSCSPPGFYGTSDMHMRLEREIANFLGMENSIVYSQGFSTISGVIPAFCKRGDIIVADSGVNFAIQKGLQLSRSTVYWYDHNDMESLEIVLQHVVDTHKSSRSSLQRRFIVTEGLFENDGAITDLRKVVELKKRYKFRMFLDESYSVGTLGATGRGLTEAQDVDSKDVDFIVGNLAVSFGAAGGFCACSDHAVHHQRINGLSFVFSAAMPVMCVVGSIEAMHIIQTQTDRIERLNENVRVLRAVLDDIHSIHIPSSGDSPLVHIQVRSKYEPHPSETRFAFPRDQQGGHDLLPKEQTRLLQEIVELALNHGVLLTRARRLPSINAKVLDVGVEARPSIRIALTSELTTTEVHHAAEIVRACIVRVLGERR